MLSAIKGPNMSIEAASVVQYSGFGPWQTLRVRRLESAGFVADASSEMRSIALSALRRYEGFWPLPAGTVAGRYDERHDDAFRHEAVDQYRRGSQFWAVRLGGEMIGFARVSGEATEESHPGVVRIDEVAVSPDKQGSHYGSALLHAA